MVWPALRTCCCIAVVCASGCIVQRSRPILRSRPTFLGWSYREVTNYGKQEVLTRQWVHSDGTLLRLLDFHVHSVTNRPRIAVARYGDAATARVYCVDVFEFRPVIDQTDASLFLLCHDYREGWVTGFEISYQGRDVVVHITRDYVEEASGKRIRNAYSYRWERESGFSPTPSDFYWEVKAE